jgi:hypothetical protein
MFAERTNLIFSKINVNHSPITKNSLNYLYGIFHSLCLQVRKFYAKADCIFLVGVRQCDRDSLMETGIRVDQEHPVPK